MLFSLLLFFTGCSYFSTEESPSVVVAEKVILQETFVSAADAIIQDVQELWEKKTQEDKRRAQKKLHQFYEKEAYHAFALLQQQHPQEVLAAEHQLGWVIYRLDHHTSRSFRREAGYLEKLSTLLHRCAELLPKEQPKPPVDSKVLETESPLEIPVDSSSVSAL